MRNDGLRLPPTPPATDESVRRSMRSNRGRDTKPEVALRKALHARGRRFWKDYRVSTETGMTVRVDVVFPRRRLAVFIDGCFWHGCTEHCRVPTRNHCYWSAKIERNRTRDARVTAELQASGWSVLRIWEHEPIESAVDRVEHLLSGDATTLAS